MINFILYSPKWKVAWPPNLYNYEGKASPTKNNSADNLYTTIWIQNSKIGTYVSVEYFAYLHWFVSEITCHLPFEKVTLQLANMAEKSLVSSLLPISFLVLQRENLRRRVSNALLCESDNWEERHFVENVGNSIELKCCMNKTIYKESGGRVQDARRKHTSCSQPEMKVQTM